MKQYILRPGTRMPRMPPGLLEIMEDLSREVIRNNPTDLYDFCAHHMKNLLQIREASEPKVKKKLTLEQKIFIAQMKIREKAKERRRLYDKYHKKDDKAHIPSIDKLNTINEETTDAIKDKTLNTNLSNENVLNIGCNENLMQAQESVENKDNEITNLLVINNKDGVTETENDNIESETQPLDEKTETSLQENIVTISDLKEESEIMELSTELNKQENIVGISDLTDDREIMKPTIDFNEQENIDKISGFKEESAIMVFSTELNEEQNICENLQSDVESLDTVRPKQQETVIKTVETFDSEDHKHSFELEITPEDEFEVKDENQRENDLQMTVPSDSTLIRINNDTEDVEKINKNVGEITETNTTIITLADPESELNPTAEEKESKTSDGNTLIAIKLPKPESKDEIRSNNEPTDNDHFTIEKSKKEGDETSIIEINDYDLEKVKTDLRGDYINNPDALDKNPIETDSTDETNAENSCSDSGVHHDDDKNDEINSLMDMEKAAITIQKVFRSFLFKSRNSTLEDVSNDEESLDHFSDIALDDDVISKKDEVMNGPRSVGITRMDSILQTVNEEKSLSVSTDDSSTLSSAATVIQAQVRGYLARKKFQTMPTSSLANSGSTSPLSGQEPEQLKNKMVLNIHIAPEGTHYISRDESMAMSLDLPLDHSPPLLSKSFLSLGNDVSERRKQLKREDAIQSISPPSNNSNGKLSEEVESLKDVSIDQKDSVDQTIEKNYGKNSVPKENIENHKPKEEADILIQKQSNQENNEKNNAIEPSNGSENTNPLENDYDNFKTADKQEPLIDDRSQSLKDDIIPIKPQAEVENDSTEKIQTPTLVSNEPIYKKDEQSPLTDMITEEKKCESKGSLEINSIETVEESTGTIRNDHPPLRVEVVAEEKKCKNKDSLETNIIETGMELPKNLNEDALSLDTKDRIDVSAAVKYDQMLASSMTKNSSQMFHSSEFHDMLIPTNVTRGETTVIRGFKSAFVYLLIWNNN